MTTKSDVIRLQFLRATYELSVSLMGRIVSMRPCEGCQESRERRS